MKELQIVTNSFTPAKVDFNYDQISNQLDVLLAKYKGLVFTEKTVADCKKTIAELRKGQRSLDDFRKKTKKELTKSVTEFENQCKKLYKKFDTVIDPLVEQADDFEKQRREEKRQKVQKIVDGLIKEQGLNEKYANQLIIEDQYLNKSKSLKSIKEELGAKAKGLGIQQDKENADKELIRTRLELVNAKYNIDLASPPYERLLDYENIEDIIAKINIDVERMINKPAPVKEVRTSPVTPVMPATPEPPAEDEAIYLEKYEVEGTEEQLEALETYMTAAGLEWTTID